MWCTDFLDFTVSGQENNVSNEVEKRVPGVPDGYRLVGIGGPKKGQHYVNVAGSVSVAASDWDGSNNLPIVEPVEPLKPKSGRPVVLNRYLVGVGVPTLCTVLVATPEYMDMHYYDYKLIGPSETVTIEVE